MEFLKKKSARQLQSEMYFLYLTKTFIMLMQQHPSHRKYSTFFKSNFNVSYRKQAFQN